MFLIDMLFLIKKTCIHTALHSSLASPKHISIKLLMEKQVVKKLRKTLLVLVSVNVF